MYLGLDEYGEALAWLERAFHERDPRMTFLKVEPKWKCLRGNAEFLRFLNRLKLAP